VRWRRPGGYGYLVGQTKEVAVMKTVRSAPGLCRLVSPVFVLVAACLSARAPALATILYKLDAASSYQEGCFDPCMCPIMMNDTLQGTFFLSPVGGEDGTTVYAVTDVAWSYRRGEAWVQVAGSGSYTLGLGGQRLELDLVAGHDPWRHFDSGLVAAPGSFPGIAIAAAANGFFCYDHVFAVSASAVAVGSEDSTWGALKATYR
jgi:hypothetical protein